MYLLLMRNVIPEVAGVVNYTGSASWCDFQYRYVLDYRRFIKFNRLLIQLLLLFIKFPLCVNL